MRLSPSKIATIFRCPREYAFQYLLNVKTKKSKPLLFGTAFHQALEGKEPDLVDLKALDPEYPFHSALRTMLAGHKAATAPLPPSMAREVVYETPEIKLVADEFRVEDSGDWFLCENKTASTLDENKRLMLPNEIQMVCYAAHAPFIAETFWLDPAKFAGVIYMTSLKPMERRTKKETIDEFGARLTSTTHVWRYPVDKFRGVVDKWKTLTEFAEKRADEVQHVFDRDKGVDRLPCNSASCVRFGNRCPYFEVCLGVTIDVK